MNFDAADGKYSSKTWDQLRIESVKSDEYCTVTELRGRVDLDVRFPAGFDFRDVEVSLTDIDPEPEYERSSLEIIPSANIAEKLRADLEECLAFISANAREYVDDVELFVTTIRKAMSVSSIKELGAQYGIDSLDIASIPKSGKPTSPVVFRRKACFHAEDYPSMYPANRESYHSSPNTEIPVIGIEMRYRPNGHVGNARLTTFFSRIVLKWGSRKGFWIDTAEVLPQPNFGCMIFTYRADGREDRINEVRKLEFEKALACGRALSEQSEELL